MAVPLAAAFVRLEPDTNTSGFVKEGQKAGKAAGEAAGKEYADGFYRDASGRLRQANGRFATDAQKRMLEGGGASGEGFGREFNKKGGGIIRRGFEDLKSSLGGLLIPAGVGAAVIAIGQIGMTYEDNLNILKAVTKATGAEMDQVAAKARDLGTDITLPGVSAAGAAAAMTELAKAGFTVQEAMDAAKGTLQLARVAGLSEAEASTIAASAVNAFGIEAKETMFVVDELAAAANTSSLEVKDASDSFKMAAAVFSAFQGPAVGSKEAITELTTAIAILGNNGIRGSDAGTSLKQMLLQLTGPSDKAKNVMEAMALAAYEAEGGMNKLYMTAKDGTKVDTGLTLMQAALQGTKKQSDEALNQLAKLNPKLGDVGDIAYDASGKMRPLRDIIGLVTKGLEGQTEEARNAALTQVFGADATRSVIALMKGGLGTYDAQRKAIMEQGAAADFAAAKNAGLRGAIDAVKSQLENAAIAIYNAVKGPLTTATFALAEGLGATFSWIGENIVVIKDWAIAIGIVTAAIKLQSIYLAVNAAGGIAAYVKGMRVATSTTRLWAAANAFLSASMAASPIGIILVAIAALVAGFVLAYKHVGWFRNAVDVAWAAIKKAIGAVVDWITGTVWPSLQRAWQSIADAALWLWRNAILPAWNGIKAAIDFAGQVIAGVISGVVAAFRVVASIAQWLYANIFQPVFAAITKVFEIWWLAVQVVFTALYKIIRFVVASTVQWLYEKIFKPVFDAIVSSAQWWWGQFKYLFGLFMTYVGGPIAQGLRTLRDGFMVVFRAVRDMISGWWKTYVKPVFEAVVAGWKTLSGGISGVYNNTIKPLFQKFIGFVQNDLVGGFQKGVEWIGKAWDGLKEVAKKPVAFVVNQVINPFITGLNKAAEIVGVKDRVEPIKGFAAGGQIPGYANGGRIAGMRAATDNRQAMVSGLGPVNLMGGEYIVNARDTARALPLLEWINGGMGGYRKSARDGSNEPGLGYADGGVVGWAKDVWGAISDPVELIKKPFNAVMNRIPGGGMIKDFLKGSGKRVLDASVKWLNSFLGLDATGKTIRTGIRAGWPSSPSAQRGDSGVWRRVVAVIKASGIDQGSFGNAYRPGDPKWHGSGRAVDWMGYNMDALATYLARMRPLELIHRTKNRDYAFTRGTNQGSFNEALMEAHRNHIHIAMKRGGLLTPALFDGGGRWPSGTVGMNMSGHDEHVMTGGPGGDMDRMLSLLSAILDRLGALGGDVAEALERPTRRAVQIGRSGGPAMAR
jgi:TP901 family phage tail tape measure protein